MKELLIEEKAKRYDEAIEKAIEFKNNPFAGYSGTDLISALFPELKEFEDEKIKRELIDFFKGVHAYPDFKGIPFERVVAYLEKHIHTDFALENEYWRGYDDAKKQGEQKPAAWSEEDERMLKSTVALMETLEDINKAPDGFGDVIIWLKSLKPQNRWKPSEKQIEALNYVINLMASSKSPKENDYYYNVFKGLREQLKK